MELMHSMFQASSQYDPLVAGQLFQHARPAAQLIVPHRAPHAAHPAGARNSFVFFLLLGSINHQLVSVCVCVSLMACFLFSLALAGAAQPDVQRDVVHVDAGVVVVVVVVDGRPRRRRLRPALPAARRRRPARRPEFRPRRRDARRPPAGRAAGQPHRIGQGGNIIFNDLLIKKD